MKAINYLEANDCQCICLDDCSVENMCKYVGDCDAILARTADFNQQVLEKGTKLKIVARHGAGLDNIDLEYARKRGIVVTNTPGANSKFLVYFLNFPVFTGFPAHQHLCNLHFSLIFSLVSKL